VQQELLEKNPSADIKVYAVWFNMLPSDSRSRWEEELLTDQRVIHLWDEGKILGRFHASRLDYPGEVMWDAYLLYGSGASWKSDPPPVISWGYTIVRTRERLQRDLLALLRKSTSSSPRIRPDRALPPAVSTATP
jgi:hypothetical protein